MKPLLALLLASLAWLPAASGGSGEPSRTATTVDALLPPGTEIADPEHDPAWKDLFSSLAPKSDQESPFQEARMFPFRTRPVVLTGKIRIDPERGLSLDYTTPEVRTIILDRQGALIREADGQSHSASAGGGSREQSRTASIAIEALGAVMRFDAGALQRDFEIRGIKAGSAWTLVFAPRDPALAGNLRAVVVSGVRDAISRIQLLLSPAPRVDIQIGATRKNAPFSAAELERYFR